MSEEHSTVNVYAYDGSRSRRKTCFSEQIENSVVDSNLRLTLCCLLLFIPNLAELEGLQRNLFVRYHSVEIIDRPARPGKASYRVSHKSYYSTSPSTRTTGTVPETQSFVPVPFSSPDAFTNCRSLNNYRGRQSYICKLCHREQHTSWIVVPVGFL